VVIGVLAATYLGSITFVSTLLSADSDLAVASSTLAVALLFNPLLRRVRVTVDRRFNRAAYDAQRLGEQFATTLQVRADPRAVVETWVAVVAEAIGPRTIGVWIRPAASAPATTPTTPRP
jgi:hypothetical protein